MRAGHLKILKWTMAGYPCQKKVPLGRKIICYNFRSNHWRCSINKDAFKNFRKFTRKHLCQSFFFKKETSTQVFSCEFSKIFKNTHFTEHHSVTTSISYIIALAPFLPTSKLVRTMLDT